MNPAPDLTCVIAAYNAEARVAAAIESVLGQGVPCDVIVVDDGSTDGTVELVCQSGAAVRLIQQANAGPGAARNRGVAEAATGWIAFLDSDDRWLPGHVTQWRSALMECPDAAVFYSGARLVDQQGNLVGLQPGHPIARNPFLDLLIANWIPTSGVFIRRSEFLDVGGFDLAHRHGEDWDLWLRLAARGGTWVRLPGDLVEYRQGEDSLSRDFDAICRVNLALQLAIRYACRDDGTRHEGARHGDLGFRHRIYDRTVAPPWGEARSLHSLSGLWSSIGRLPAIRSVFLEYLPARGQT